MYFWAICSLRTGQSKLERYMAFNVASGHITILAWTAQSVNCHIALKVMFYLLNAHFLLWDSFFGVIDHW